MESKDLWLSDWHNERQEEADKIIFQCRMEVEPRFQQIRFFVEILQTLEVDCYEVCHEVSMWTLTGSIDAWKSEIHKLIAKVRPATLRAAGVPEGYLVALDWKYCERVAHDLLKGEGEVRNEIGLILMENEEGNVSVHLYDKKGRAEAAFGEMAGSPGDPKIRATLVSVDYDGSAATISSKDLPNPQIDGHDAWVLGKGPIDFSKEEEDDKADG